MLIGITGKAGSGKDTVARMLQPYGFQRMAFADPLKIAAATLFGWDLERVLTDDDFKKTIDKYWERSVRNMLQVLGTEAMRACFGDDFWIKRWKLGYDQHKLHSHIVVTDVRFENEADAIRAEGGIVLHLHGRGGLSGEGGAHASEAGVAFKVGDSELLNDSTLEILEHRLGGLMSFIAMEFGGAQ